MNFDGMTPRDAAEMISAKCYETVHDFIADVTTACQHFSNEALERGRRYNHQALVAEFHRAMGIRIQERPGFPPQDRMDLRVRLIAEEFCEFLRDAGYGYDLRVSLWNRSQKYTEVFNDHLTSVGASQDFTKSADALIDLEYVILGTHLEFGVESQPLFEEVHAANMRKVGGPIVNGKIGKPDNWNPPDIQSALHKQGWDE